MYRFLTMVFLCFSLYAYSQGNWHETYTSDRKCSVLFPDEPTVLSNPQTGGEVYTCIKNNSIFMFTVEDFKGRVKDQKEPDIHDEDLKKSCYDGIFAAYNGTLISDNNIIFKDKKGVDFYLTINIPGSNLKYMKGRYLLDNSIVYLAIYGYSNFNKNDFEGFVNSIEFY